MGPDGPWGRPPPACPCQVNVPTVGATIWPRPRSRPRGRAADGVHMRCLGGRPSLPTTKDKHGRPAATAWPAKGPSPGRSTPSAARYEHVDRDVARPSRRLVLRNNAPRSRESRSWAGRFTEQRWAIESAGGLGYFLAQLIAACGRHHVPPTLSAHARVLGSRKSQRTQRRPVQRGGRSAPPAPARRGR